MIKKESQLNFLNFPLQPIRWWFNVKMSELEHDDNMFMSLTGITEAEQGFFTIKEIEKENFFRNFFSAGEIFIHLDLDLHLIKRSVINWWNILGEIGGLYGVIFGAFFVLNSIGNH